MPKPEINVCVIGAGPCGLTTIKNLLEQGITQITVFEKNPALGGNWRFDENNEHSSVYETTHLISSKRLSGYVDFPMPEVYPDYPSHHQVLEYFQAYSTHFNLLPYIQFNKQVHKITRCPNTLLWEVFYEDSHGQRNAYFDYVLIANGHHWSPTTPTYPGEFKGEILHAHQYKKAMPFKNKKVLVVGAGNSACDIAVEVARVASKTTLSMRQGQHIFPKFMFGKPTDIAFSKIAWLPFRIQQIFAKWAIRVVQGRYSKYQLQTPNNKALSTHPTINSELLYALRHGKILSRGKIESLKEDQVHFTDGSFDTYDSIIFATGYQINFPFFEPDFIDYRQIKELPLYLNMMHPDYDTLYFIGLFQPQGCIWPLADYQAKIVGKILAGQKQRPSHLKSKIQKERARTKRCFEPSPRHVLEVDTYRFKKQLLEELKKD